MQNKMMTAKSIGCLGAVAAACVGGRSSLAAMVNVANNVSVVAGSGDFPNGAINTGGNYATSNVTDGQNASPDNNTGAITEPGQDGSYWLGHQGESTGYFVLDLGTAQGLASFQLFNARNGPYDDRGTGNFTIFGSNTLSNLSGAAIVTGGASDATLLASGTLTSQTYAGAFGNPGTTPLVSNSFASLDSTPFEYVRFDALSIGASEDKGYNAGGVGLNEFRAFAVPEPATLGLICVAGLGLLRRRRAY